MMEKKRVLIACVMTALLALTVVVAGCTSSTSNNNTSTVPTKTSANVSITTTTNATNVSMKTTTNATNVTNGKTTTVAQGQNFAITLRTNPSTGYSWEPKFDRTALSLVDSVFVSDPNPYNLVGVPGSQVFTFQGLSKGTTILTFDNVSPSQVVTEQATYTVTVT